MNIALIAAGMLGNKKESTWLTIFNLAKEYKRQGHYVVIIAKSTKYCPPIEVVKGIPVYRLFGGWKIGKLVAAAKTIDFLQRSKKIKFDILHGFSSSPLLSLELRIAKKNAPGAKIIHTLKSYSKFPITDKFYFMLRYADVITAPTTIAAGKIPLKFKDKVKIIHSNIDIGRFKPRNKSILLDKYGFKDKKLILNYGALRWEKGVDDLIRAAPLVLREIPEACFLFLVRSKETVAKEKYLALAKEVGCKDNISIRLDDVPIEEFVSMADAVVLAYPTLQGTEGNPSCLLEAMASKTAVVTTSLSEIKEIVHHEKEVLMAEPSDYVSLAENIVKILKDSRLQEEITENSYVLAQYFSTEKITAEFLKLYTNTNSLKDTGQLPG